MDYLIPNKRSRTRLQEDSRAALLRAGLTNVAPGTTAYSLLSAIDGKVAAFWNDLEEAIANGFPSQASGIYLDLWGQTIGMTRLGSGPVKIRDNQKFYVSRGVLGDYTGGKDITLGPGLEVLTEDGQPPVWRVIPYRDGGADQPVWKASQREIFVRTEALTPGAAANTGAGKLTRHNLPYDFVMTTNVAPITAARRVEDDDSFRFRLLDAYPLTPAVILPEKDGYELELVAHAFRSDIGHRIQVGSAPAVSIGEPDQVVEVSQGQSFRLLLPPLVPVTPQDFSKEVSGWGLGNSKVANRTFTAVADPRIAPGGSCRGLITSAVGMLVSSELRPGQTAFSRIVVGTPHSDFRLYWLDRSSGIYDPLPSLVPVPLGLSREGRSLLWVNDYLLPTTSPRRLGIAFPAAAGQERSVYGVWLFDEAPAWQVLVEKDGAAWNGATGFVSWTDVGALPTGKAMSRPSLHSLLLDGSLPKGSYRFRLVAQTIGSTLRQAVGNYLYHELAGAEGATETNQGTEVQIQVKVN